MIRTVNDRTTGIPFELIDSRGSRYRANLSINGTPYWNPKCNCRQPEAHTRNLYLDLN